jgi:hypothetical protein
MMKMMLVVVVVVIVIIIIVGGSIFSILAGSFIRRWFGYVRYDLQWCDCPRLVGGIGIDPPGMNAKEEEQRRGFVMTPLSD